MTEHIGKFLTSDGVTLQYRQSGEGPPLIMLSGFGQNMTGFNNNYPVLEKHFTVYSFDYRAHGQSEAPSNGYRIERFAKDFYDFLEYLKREEFYLIAHSMGNAIAWSYMSIFGQEKIVKYVLEDQAPCMVCNPVWTEEEREMYTGLFQWESVWEPLGPYTDENEDPLIQKQLLLLRDHLGRDWRSVVEDINIPTLIVMGADSHYASEKLWQWMNQHIRESKLEIISKEHGGKHDMHLKSADVFNRLVLDFLVD